MRTYFDHFPFPSVLFPTSFHAPTGHATARTDTQLSSDISEIRCLVLSLFVFRLDFVLIRK